MYELILWSELTSALLKRGLLSIISTNDGTNCRIKTEKTIHTEMKTVVRPNKLVQMN